MLRAITAANRVDIDLVVARVLDGAMVRCGRELVKIVGGFAKRRGQRWQSVIAGNGGVPVDANRHRRNWLTCSLSLYLDLRAQERGVGGWLRLAGARESDSVGRRR